MTDSTIHIGDTIRIRCEFKNIARVLTDPTTITLEIKPPVGNTVSYTYALAELTRETTGVYYYDHLITAGPTWEWRFIGTGAVAQVDQGRIHVVPKNT